MSIKTTRQNEAGQTTQVETTHDAVGYFENLKIIETALQEKFGIDQCLIGSALAKMVWHNVVCAKMSPVKWGVEEIAFQVEILESRARNVGKSLPSLK